jgi:hypothetical protein
MLPFLKPRKQSASVSVSTRTAEGNESERHEESEVNPELLKHSEGLLSAMANKDALAVAKVMQEIHGHFNAKLPDDGTPA